MDRYFSAYIFPRIYFKFIYIATKFQNSKASRLVVIIISAEEHDAWSEDEPSKPSHRDAHVQITESDTLEVTSSLKPQPSAHMPSKHDL